MLGENAFVVIWALCYIREQWGGLCRLRVVSNGLRHLCGCSQALAPRRTRPLQEPTHSGYWVCAVPRLQGPEGWRGSDPGMRKRSVLGMTWNHVLKRFSPLTFLSFPSFFSFFSPFLVFPSFLFKIVWKSIRKKRKKCRMELPATEGWEDKKSDKRKEIGRKMTRMRWEGEKRKDRKRKKERQQQWDPGKKC